MSTLRLLKRYVLALLFAAASVWFYDAVDIQMFSFDITRRVRENLFNLKNPAVMDTDVVIVNLGVNEPDAIPAIVDTLLSFKPRVIGINPCHYESGANELKERYRDIEGVVLARCEDSGFGTLAAIIDERNRVERFRTGEPLTFESLLTGFKGRGNDTEILNYRGEQALIPDISIVSMNFYEIEVDDLQEVDPEILEGKIVLLGYTGDYLTDTLYYFRQTRITPLNPYYRYSNVSPDMYDIEISANIISAIGNEDFIDEAGDATRVGILFLFSVMAVALLTLTRKLPFWAMLLSALIFFILFTGFGSWLILFLFLDGGYYLSLDELPIMLVIIMVFTVVLNIHEKRPVKE